MRVQRYSYNSGNPIILENISLIQKGDTTIMKPKKMYLGGNNVYVGSIK